MLANYANKANYGLKSVNTCHAHIITNKIMSFIHLSGNMISFETIVGWFEVCMYNTDLV
ncbi:protein of unknown function [Moritella yayanosii]|uniref:Transposase n=1 Tax=Moritella yayanosii TaxID=69539 RepID=A0A330LU77_9GAMM|nr:protein of unknown function [Moritella yayanosii]